MPREWSPRWPKRRVEGIKKQVEDWLKENGLDPGAHVYTREEWKARGEKYGNDAVVTIAAEGPFYGTMNYPEHRYARELQERFNEFLTQLGLWYEQGFAWTWHLYPTEQSGPVIGAGELRKTTILHLLSEIALPKRKLVLMQEGRYFTLADLIAQARRGEKSGDARTKAALAAPIYWAEQDADDRLVIWRATPTGKKASFVEVGSKIQTDLS